MSGDSPSAHATEGFDFIDGHASPAPTTSKDVGVQNPGIVQASVLVEPQKEGDKDKDKDDESAAFISPIANSTEETGSGGEADKTLKIGDSDGGDKNHDDKKGDDDKKKNEGTDKLDAVFVPAKSDKKYQDYNNPDNDSCCIKCLSFTLECCECTIS